MPHVLLDVCDLFRVARGLAFSELKTLRRTSDVFGDELKLGPQSPLAEAPAEASQAETEAAARRVAAFFQLPGQAWSDLAALPTLGDWAGLILDRIGPRPAALTFFTSGSTGAPKAVPKPCPFLEEDARFMAGLLAGTRRLVSLVPPHHIYGFIASVLIPKILGLPVEDRRFQRPAALVRDLRAHDAVIAIPRLWKLLADTREAFPASAVGMTSTGPCPAEVIRSLRRLGLPVMHEIYGSSESGAMGFRSDPEAAMTLVPAWRRVGENAFVRRLEDGTDSEPFAFQDDLEWLDQTSFLVRRRTDSAVQVGGTNVFPGKAAEVLRGHEAVAEAAVRLMRPEEGDRLKAFVVLKPGFAPTPDLKESLRRHLAARLSHLEQPKSLTFGDALPCNEMGKACDWPVRSDRQDMTREEALERLRREHRPVEAGQTWEAGALRPEDAWGVARIFYAIYGENYPFDAYYIPERLLEENRRGNIFTVVARTPSGDVIGHGALYRSSAPFRGTYEIGQYLVLPEYRTSRAAFRIQRFIYDRVIPEQGVESMFGETVCHHVVTQKFGVLGGAVESALEVGLMPANAYERTDFAEARVSTLLQFRVWKDRRCALHLPAPYAETLEYLLQGFSLDRDILPAGGEPPADTASRVSTEVYDFAQVARLHVTVLGHDFPAVVKAFEKQALKRGCRVMQAFLDLGDPCCGSGADALRARGYFLGGLLPRWFDTDGLLLQKVLDPPPFESIKLHSERAHRILDLIRRDMESNPACLSPRSETRAPARPPRTDEVREVVLSGRGLGVRELAAVARHGAEARIAQDPAVAERVEASAAFIQWAVETGEPIYGVNTGFGGMAGVRVPADELAALQNNLPRFLNAGAGGYLSREDVRAAMLLRVNSHLSGASGVRREILDRMVAFLNAGATPLVRDLGSIGASGDLVPLASIAGAVMGLAPCFRVDLAGEVLDCREALANLGLAPLPLGPKEGLAMVNGTSVMTGMAALRVHDARRLLGVLLGFHALAVQALRGTNQSFHPFIQKMKPHPGQVLAAEILLDLLHGSRMCRDELDGHHAALDGQPVQDRYSLRCLPQFLGPVLDGLGHAARAVETEMNSANDNPLIDAPAGVSYHGGNFLGQYVAVWMDHLRWYLGLAAKHADAQMALLAAPEFSQGLPASLVGNPDRPVNMGLKGLQIAANSVLPLITFHGAPVADRFPTHAEQYNQNVNSQGFNAARLAGTSLDLFRTHTAMGLVFGVQAVALRSRLMAGTCDPRPLLSPATAALYEAVLAALGRKPSKDRPLVFDDDEQSLEALVEALSADLAGEEGAAAATAFAAARLG